MCFELVPALGVRLAVKVHEGLQGSGLNTAPAFFGDAFEDVKALLPHALILSEIGDARYGISSVTVAADCEASPQVQCRVVVLEPRICPRTVILCLPARRTVKPLEGGLVVASSVLVHSHCYTDIVAGLADVGEDFCGLTASCLKVKELQCVFCFARQRH